MQHNAELAQKALIPVPGLARDENVASTMIMSTARRLGIQPQQLPNGRYMLTFVQAQAVVTELHRPRA
jgi:hypothetical protein